MKRWLFNITAVLTLLLLLATVGAQFRWLSPVSPDTMHLTGPPRTQSNNSNGGVQ